MKDADKISILMWWQINRIRGGALGSNGLE